MRFLSVIRWILWKDLLCEIRSRESLSSMFFFALIVILIFGFSLPVDRWAQKDTEMALMSGIIWIAIGFTGVTGLGRIFLSETRNDCMEALQLAPVHKGAIYLGKFIGNFLLMLSAALVLLPAFGLFFNINLFNKITELSVILLGATLGFCALGTLFSAMTVQVRARDAMFPILLLPLTVPLFIGAVEATRSALTGMPFALYRHWIELLFIFDIIMSISSLWLFEWVIEA